MPSYREIRTVGGVKQRIMQNLLNICLHSYYIAKLLHKLRLIRNEYFFKLEMSCIIWFRKRKRKSIISGLFLGLSQSFFLLSNAAAFRLAGYLVQSGQMGFTDVMK